MNDEFTSAYVERRLLRQQWIGGVACFPITAFLSIALVSCMCNIGSMKVTAMLILCCFSWIRLFIGLICLERKGALYFYFLLPLPSALLLNALTQVVLDH
jgi:hypothetical protein